MSLDLLPDEILVQVFDRVLSKTASSTDWTSYQALCALNSVSKRFAFLVNFNIWKAESIRIDFAELHCLEKFYNQLEDMLDVLQGLKEIILTNWPDAEIDKLQFVLTEKRAISLLGISYGDVIHRLTYSKCSADKVSFQAVGQTKECFKLLLLEEDETVRFIHGENCFYNGEHTIGRLTVETSHQTFGPWGNSGPAEFRYKLVHDDNFGFFTLQPEENDVVKLQATKKSSNLSSIVCIRELQREDNYLQQSMQLSVISNKSISERAKKIATPPSKFYSCVDECYIPSSLCLGHLPVQSMVESGIPYDISLQFYVFNNCISFE